MRLWRGDGTLVRVRWFRCPDGAPLVPQPNPFVSSVWDESRTQINPALGEMVRVGYDPEKGANVDGYLGLHPCGPVAAWHLGGVHGVTPELVTDSFGVTPCCTVANLTAEGGAGAGGGALIPLRGLGGAGAGRSGFQAGPGYIIISISVYPYWAVVRSGGYYQIGTGGAGAGGAGLQTNPWWQVARGGAGAGGWADEGQDVYFVGDYRWNFSNAAIAGWELCDGRLLLIATYPVLAAKLGTTFGGDGIATFGLPDSRSRSLVGGGAGAGLTARVPGNQGGLETVLLTVAEMPSHVHDAIDAGAGNYIGYASSGGGPGATVNTGLTLATNPKALSGAKGGSGAHENMHPWECVGFLFIKT